VTSAGDHNFSVCVGSPLYPGTLDDLFKLPHVDRRCLGSNEYATRNKALVGVYSDTKPLNLKAAKEWCALNKLTNE
jgi:hypothetical protein